MLYEQLTRDLNNKEINFLKIKIEDLQRKKRPISSIILVQAVIGFGIAALICLLGFLASRDKPPIWFFLLIFLLPGTIWTLWFTKDSLKEQKYLVGTLPNLQDALKNGKVKVERIKSERMIEIEEREDEGACYLFEVESKKLFLLFGQEYYATSEFPSSDFSLIDILDTRGNRITSLIETNGTKLIPYRIISAKNKIKDLIDYESKFINCGIDELESYFNE